MTIELDFTKNNIFSTVTYPMSNVINQYLLIAITLLFGYTPLCTFANEDAYWVWRTSDMTFVKATSTLYVYQGDYAFHNTKYNSRHPYLFTQRGVQPSSSYDDHTVIPLVRIYELKEPATLAKAISKVIDQWLFHKIKIEEIQLDYDSPSAGLHDYAKFLAELKKELNKPEYPFTFRISVTGLVTWLADNPQDLELLTKQSSYIHYQLYNNFEPLEHIQPYLEKLEKVKHPHKLGITRSPLFTSMELPKNEYYLGTAIFLNRP
jgi:hypothetical protein